MSPTVYNLKSVWPCGPCSRLVIGRKVVYGNKSHLETSSGKFGVPSPVTGSHPGTAVKPSVLHPGFEPEVISLKAPWKRGE